MSAVVAARLHQGDGLVHVVAAADVGVAHGRRRAADREAAVVAGPVAVVAVQDVEEGRVAGAQDAVGVDVGVGRAALPGDGVDPLDVLGAEVVEDLGDQADALVLPDPGAQEPVQLVVGGVDQGGRGGQQGDLVGGLDPAGVQEHLLAVDHLEPGRLQGGQHRQLGQVDPDRLAGQPVGLQLPPDLGRDPVGDAGVGVEGAAQGGDPGPGPALLGVGGPPVQPGVVELVVAGGGAEVPDHRLAAPGQQGEADQLVHRPGADVGRGHVADVVEVEAEQGAQLRAVQRLLQPRQPLGAEPVEVDPLLPVDGVRPVRADAHGALPPGRTVKCC